jgi:3-deoxy-D-manno-octulosonic-acid transferase
MPWLFNFAYLCLLAVVWPWLVYAAITKGKYRRGWSKRLLGRVPRRTSRRPCVWLHAVSVGEVQLLQPLVARLERDYPDWDVVISATTATGLALARRKYAPRQVFDAPLDFSWAVSRALARVRPDVLLLAELEVWPNLIRAAKRRGVRVGIVNGRLSDRSYAGYRRLRWLLRPAFEQLDLVAAQSAEYAERFVALGCSPAAVHATGSLKFDGAQSNRANENTLRLARLAHFSPSDVVFLAGSTQEPEESLALDAYLAHRDAFPALRLVLVPRHPERFADVAKMLDRRSVRWQRRSELREGATPTDARVLLVDAMGELGAWWGAAHIAFVGGSFGNRGGQNMLEPAAYGAAVCFGPNTSNFRDIVASLLSAHGAVQLQRPEDLAPLVGRFLREPQFAHDLGARAAAFVAQQQGAAEKTMDLLKPLMHPAAEAPARRAA